jgi:hypothetical protein
MYYIRIDDGSRSSIQPQYVDPFTVGSEDADAYISRLNTRMVSNANEISHQSTVDNTIIQMSNK